MNVEESGDTPEQQKLSLTNQPDEIKDSQQEVLRGLEARISSTAPSTKELFGDRHDTVKLFN